MCTRTTFVQAGMFSESRGNLRGSSHRGSRPLSTSFQRVHGRAADDLKKYLQSLSSSFHLRGERRSETRLPASRPRTSWHWPTAALSLG